MDKKEIVLNNIFNRKSVRVFTHEAIDESDLITLIKAGMSAPSAINLQPWEFLIFNDKNTLDFMIDLHDYSKMFKTATAGILVCGNMDRTLKEFEEGWIQDCSASVENILLAAEAMDLGAVWLGIYPVHERIEKLRNYFKLPENIIPFAVVALGYPAKKDKPKNKWDESKLHINKW